MLKPQGLNQAVIILIPAYKPGGELIDLVQSLNLSLEKDDEILVVDDGSGEEHRHIFEQLENEHKIRVLRHAVNLGKGHALKTGFNEILLSFPNAVGVVTADADGQHLPEDIIKVRNKLAKSTNALILGARSFGKDVPLRSKFGNLVTSKVSHFMLGQKISDTQTGLRGISLSFLNQVLRLKSSGYDYEMEMLVAASEFGLAIFEVPISTVYIENNKSSHFNAFRDSLAIYFVLMRHTLNSVLTAAVDFAFFSIAFLVSGNILGSMVVGRIFGGGFNFLVGKKYVFRSRRKVGRELFLFSLLVLLILLLSYAAIESLIILTNCSPYLAKIIAESVLFLLSFSIQKIFIFRPHEEFLEGAATNWDKYYDRRKSPKSFFSLISGKFLLKTFKQYQNSNFSVIVELGGGDSCFYKAFKQAYPESCYIIVEKSPIGINKFLYRNYGCNIQALQKDVLEPLDLQADLVYSCELISYFNQAGTKGCIAAHFNAAKTQGLVGIAYPIPSPVYRLTRYLAEFLDIWNFPDQRPLSYAEVSKEMSKHGEILLRKTNWFSGFTQELVIARKF